MAFIIKKSQSVKPQQKNASRKREEIIKKETVKPIEKKEATVEENKDKKKEIIKVMDKISTIESIVNNTPNKDVKRIKRDKGLIERTESSKTILTEDNKQLLVD